MTGTCCVCGDRLERRRGARGRRCGTCAKYRARNGHDRPFDLVARLTQRDIEREFVRNHLAM